MKELLTLAGTRASYTVERHLGGTETFTLYLCRAGDSPGQRILKIATAPEHNGLLDREAYLLKYLDAEAARVEAEYAAVKKGESMMNYNLSFPHLEESFIALNQGKRRVNIMSFVGVDTLGTLVPIGHIQSREHSRIDPRTSAWIMGKILKTLMFAHNRTIAIRAVTGDNILIQPDQHYVTIFDWTQAERFKTALPREAASEDIAHAARELILALGGDPTTGTLPSSDQLTDESYAEFLHTLSLGREADARKAHTDFYALIRGRWPREFYPYTTIRT